MDEKIDLLHNYLPSFLVENKSMYSILSLGIHELDEKTCLANFDTLRVAIEIILDEKLDEFRKQEKIKAAKKKLEALKGDIKK
jgi:succinate dehydrogenase/fumarate reductase flavoprotein subunit